MLGCFITATDTGVGKTVLAAAICCELRARGHRVVASKPVVTGLDEPADGVPPDHVLLAACTGQQTGQVCSTTFGPAVSPHLAASMAGITLDATALCDAPLDAWRAAADDEAVLVVEGVGGLLVPLTPGLSIRDHAVALGLGLVIAARPGLGTINHTLLTIECARAVGLEVRAVVLTPWPASPSDMEESNAETIGRLGQVPVAFLPEAASLTPDAIATAARSLDVESFVASA